MVQAVYPGSFDPLHNGHVDIIRRASRIYDRVTVAALNNPLKASQTFGLEQRLTIIEDTVSDLDNVEVELFEGLLVRYVETLGAQVIIKGLRSGTDFDYELQMAHLNRHIGNAIDTAFMMTAAQWSYVSSTRVKELARYGADVSGLVPAASLRALQGVKSD